MAHAKAIDTKGKVIPIARDLKEGTAAAMRATLHAAGIPDALITEREALCQAYADEIARDGATLATTLAALGVINDFDFVDHPEVGRAILKKPRSPRSHNAPSRHHPGLVACDPAQIADPEGEGRGETVRSRRVGSTR